MELQRGNRVRAVLVAGLTALLLTGCVAYEDAGYYGYPYGGGYYGGGYGVTHVDIYAPPRHRGGHYHDRGGHHDRRHHVRDEYRHRPRYSREHSGGWGEGDRHHERRRSHRRDW